MGKGKAKSGSKKPQHGQREVTPDVHKDKVAANLLNFKKPEYAGVSKNNKARDRAISKSKLALKKKKPRVYTEKELGIPKLNTSLDPVGVKVKGKKGKKFVTDNSLQLILAEVQQESNEARASKLERARQLEAIREIKRKEMEEKERHDRERVEIKKKELKKKKGSKSKEPEPAAPEPKPRSFGSGERDRGGKKSAARKERKRVSFAE